MTTITVSVVDDEGMNWAFDGKRVYCMEAEAECTTDEEREQNGYPCYSWKQALRLLKEYGYIEE